MTSREAYDIFMSIHDKYRDEGFVEANFCRLMNTATMLILKDHFYNQHDPTRSSVYKEPRYGAGATQYTDEDFNVLIKNITITASIIGQVPISDFDAFMPTDTIQDEAGVIETTRCKVFHILKVDRKETRMRWHRQNDVDETNPFKISTEEYPSYKWYTDYIQILPWGDVAIAFTIVRTPIHMWIDVDTPANDIDPELSASVMYDVILRALQLAGVNIRENTFYQMAQNEELKQ